MIESVEGIHTELQRCAFSEFCIFEQPHIPHVHAGRIEAVASQSRQGAHLCHDVTRVRIIGDVTSHAAASAGATGCKRCDTGCASCSNAYQADVGSDSLKPARVEDAAITRRIAVSVSVGT